MTYLTRDILDFYKHNDKNYWYLRKFFSNKGDIGFFEPYKENPVLNAERAVGKKGPLMTVDDHNTYEINRFGCRGKVDDNADIVASGCSITFGLGIPESARWTNLLGDKFGKSVINLGSPGSCVETVCQNIIQYSLNNKMPKQVFCLFPDFFRRMVLLDKEFYKSKTKESVDQDELLLGFCNPKVNMYKDSIFMEIENTKYIEDSISPHQLIIDSINSIYMLESFCLANNIELHWTTWHLPTSKIMEKLSRIEDFKLKNFVQFFPPNAKDPANRLVGTTCDSSHDSEFKDGISWDRGSDYSIIDGKQTSQYAHPGVHFQYHLADLFYNSSKGK